MKTHPSGTNWYAKHPSFGPSHSSQQRCIFNCSRRRRSHSCGGAYGSLFQCFWLKMAPVSKGSNFLPGTVKSNATAKQLKSFGVAEKLSISGLQLWHESNATRLSPCTAVDYLVSAADQMGSLMFHPRISIRREVTTLTCTYGGRIAGLVICFYGC